MDWNQVEGNWKQVRGNVKKQWGKLTDDDLTAIDGRREALEGRIQERYGYTKDRVRKEIEEWQRSFASQLNRSSDELADQIDSHSRRYSEPDLYGFAHRQQADQSRPRQGGGDRKPGGRGNPAEPAFGGGHRRRPRLPVRRLHASIGEDTWRANRACLIPVKGVPRIRTCQKTLPGEDKGRGKAAQSEPKLSHKVRSKRPKRKKSLRD